ncbi:hypothetical protein EIN_419740 [Entamoeba invadens IP1]|uniref:C2 domain-containing protein n=1 Tax=Entamoeba invadens IP1 TaxID=370355 RepID=A0A0A1U7V2_ENTIV|nr:hypothetical protein EIN_419740 [Entamoeba invadens IP1]ELP88025.1 hypothetical protein EIN_419740 [Entamoeba invadens IP1]|eukprot:XP_004254796.1 hypothetical protein EIN_419740 [Entamoeba invadens IP1]
MSTLFNLQIMDAHSLSIADKSSQSSDPYIKFHTSKTKTQKSKIISKTLNPRWNQTFQIKAEFGEEVVFEVWDNNTFTKDKPLGIAVLVIPEMEKNERIYDVLTIDEGGLLSINIQCVTEGVPHPKELTTSSTECVLMFNEFATSTNLFIKNAILKLKIEGKFEISSNPFIIGTGSFVTLPTWFVVKCKPNDKIIFEILTQQIVDGIGKYVGTFVVPDYRENESEENENIPIKEFGSLYMKIKCVKSVYKYSDLKQIPQDDDFGISENKKLCLNVYNVEDISFEHFNPNHDQKMQFCIEFKTSSRKKKNTAFNNFYPSSYFIAGYRFKCKIGEVIEFILVSKDKHGEIKEIGKAKLLIEHKSATWKKEELKFDTFGKLYVGYKWMRGVSEKYKEIMSC